MDDSEEWPAISHQAVISAQLLQLHRDDDGMKSYNIQHQYICLTEA